MLTRILLAISVATLGIFFYSGGYRLFWRYLPAKRLHPSLPYVPYGEAESLVLTDEPFDEAYEKLLQKIVIPDQAASSTSSFFQKYFWTNNSPVRGRSVKDLGLPVPDIFMFWLFGQSDFVLTSPELIKRVANQPGIAYLSKYFIY